MAADSSGNMVSTKNDNVAKERFLIMGLSMPPVLKYVKIKPRVTKQNRLFASILVLLTADDKDFYASILLGFCLVEGTGWTEGESGLGTREAAVATIVAAAAAIAAAM